MKHWGCTHDNTPPLPSGSSIGVWGEATREVTVTRQGGERQNRRVDKGDSEQRGGLRGAFRGDFWGGGPGHFFTSGLREIRNRRQGRRKANHTARTSKRRRDSGLHSPSAWHPLSSLRAAKLPPELLRKEHLFREATSVQKKSRRTCTALRWPEGLGQASASASANPGPGGLPRRVVKAHLGDAYYKGLIS